VPRQALPLASWHARVGGPATHSAWREVTQQDICAFARLTGDHAYIHTDPQRAAQTRFGGTIAHGLYTLSLLTAMLHEAVEDVAGVRMAVNYGFDRVRFLAPVAVGGRVRGTFSLAALQEREPGFFVFSYDASVQIEAGSRPALAARWLIGRWMDRFAADR